MSLKRRTLNQFQSPLFISSVIQWSDIYLTNVTITLLWSLSAFKIQLIHLFHSERPYNQILLKELRLSRVNRWWLLTASYPEFPQTAAGCRRVICARFARLYPPSDLTAVFSVTHCEWDFLSSILTLWKHACLWYDCTRLYFAKAKNLSWLCVVMAINKL